MDPYQQVRKTGLKLKRLPKKESKLAPEKAPSPAEPVKPADEQAVEPKDQFDLNKEIDALLASKTLTRAEKSRKLALLCKHEEALRQKLTKSHKQKIAEFNQQLSALGEHFDIPKVGPG